MNEKWIGVEDGTGGSYYKRGIPELMIRKGGHHNAKKLYHLENDIGGSYYITDPEVITNIETFLDKEEIQELQQYLYELVIQKFGIVDFLSGVEKTIKEAGNKHYQQGRADMQQDTRKAIGGALGIKW